MAQTFEKSTSSILQKCSQIIQKQPNFNSNQSHKIQSQKKKDKAKQLLLSAGSSYLSPLQEEENNKIIQKLRRNHNKKKQVKQLFIQKTDLGENQMIFNKEELEKLKQIDDEKLYATLFHRSITSPKLSENTTQNQKYFISPVMDNPHDEIQKYLGWVDLSTVKSSKDISKNKILSFQKRQNSSSASLLHGNKKSKFALLNIGSKNGIPLVKLNCQKAGKTKSSYPLMKKNSVDKGFLNTVMPPVGVPQQKRLSQQQKLSKIILQVNKKIQEELNSSTSQNKYIYMTEERRQALFECQILRRIKREIGSRFYDNLLITYGIKEKTQKAEEGLDGNKENNENYDLITKNQLDRSSSTKGFNRKVCHNAKQKGSILFKQRGDSVEAERMMQKNLNRLKEERKRVIQKISC